MSPLDFRNLILAARNKQGLSQSQAAKKWKIPLRTLQKWEQAQRRPSAKHMEKLLPILMAGPPKKSRRRKRSS